MVRPMVFLAEPGGKGEIRTGPRPHLLEFYWELASSPGKRRCQPCRPQGLAGGEEGQGRPWESSLVAVAHAVAPSTALQLLILRLLLPLAGCTLGDGDAGHLGALGWVVRFSKGRPGGSAPPPTAALCHQVGLTHLLHL